MYKGQQMYMDYIRLENILMYLDSPLQCNLIIVSTKYKNIKSNILRQEHNNLEIGEQNLEELMSASRSSSL